MTNRSPQRPDDVATEGGDTGPAADASSVGDDRQRTSRARNPVSRRLTTDPQNVAYPLLVAAAWSWRILVVLAVVALVVFGLQSLSVVVVPLAIATLITAILSPLNRMLITKLRFKASLAALTSVFLLVIVVAGLLTFAGQQIASGMSDMLAQARAGIDTIVDWLHAGPLKLSQEELKRYIDAAEKSLSGENGASDWLSRGTGWVMSAGHFLAGILIALFASFFFLAQGQQISVFLISLFPRAAQEPTYQAGRRGWVSLTSYVRVQIVVAAIDAIGIGIGAAILRLPFLIPLALLVFLASFIPIVGAIASGSVAVLIALVTHGLTTSIIMLAVVLLVQQVEAHALQPFLMGHAVNLHPLAVLLAVVIGSSLLGIVGALFAVPFLAVANSMIRYFHGYDPFPALGTDPMPAAYRPSRSESA